MYSYMRLSSHRKKTAPQYAVPYFRRINDCSSERTISFETIAISITAATDKPDLLVDFRVVRTAQDIINTYIIEICQS